MNICWKKQKKDKNIKYLEENGFKQLVKGATHLLAGYIDQAWIIGDYYFEKVDVEQYSPHSTSCDHDS